MGSKRAQILVVEDEQIVALELNDRLTKMGHTVSAMVATAEEAIQRAEALRPDLVLMDIKLRGEMDGVEAADLIRRNLNIPVVYLTAFADDQTVERAKTTEPYGYILKPFEERELHVVIEMALYRHEMARRLREAEAWRFAVLRSAGDAVLATGAEGLVKFMNPLAEALTGWKEQEAVGVDFNRVFRVTEQPERRSPPWRETLNKKLTARDGSERPIEVESATIRDSERHDVGSVWVFRDISDRRRLHDRQRLMAVAGREVSSSLDRAALLEKLTRLIAPSFGDWCMVHLRESDDGPLRAVAFGHADPAKTRVPLEHIIVGQSCVTRSIQTGETSFEQPSSSRRWVADVLGLSEEELFSPGIDAESAVSIPFVIRGRSIGALTLVSETSSRRLVEADAPFVEEVARLVATAIDNARLYESAQRALKMREDVLEIVSHDLRNPLTAVSMSAAQLARAPEKLSPERVVKNAQAIRRNVDRMGSLIDDLLDVARIDSHHLSIAKKTQQVGDLLAETAASFELAASQRSIVLDVEKPPAPIAISCDRDRILQVLSNLVGNALKLSPCGKTVRVAATRSGRTVLFAVSDEAGGIADDQVEHIFDHYWDAPSAVRKGSGLGLYIAKGIVEAHGGEIRVESRFGGGRTFFFTIPMTPAIADAAPARLSF